MNNLRKKSLLLSGLLLSISSLEVSASISQTCNISNAEFDLGILSAPYSSQPDSWYNPYYYLPFVVSGLTAFAAENEAWADYIEYWEDVDRAESLNQNLTDDKAYAFVYQVAFNMDEDGDGQVNIAYRDGDIIKGSDWNNNGLIDCFENHPVLTHTNSEISI